MIAPGFDPRIPGGKRSGIPANSNIPSKAVSKKALRALAKKVNLGYKLAEVAASALQATTYTGARTSPYPIGPGPFTGPTRWWRLEAPLEISFNGKLWEVPAGSTFAPYSIWDFNDAPWDIGLFNQPTTAAHDALLYQEVPYYDPLIPETRTLQSVRIPAQVLKNGVVSLPYPATPTNPAERPRYHEEVNPEPGALPRPRTRPARVARKATVTIPPQGPVRLNVNYRTARGKRPNSNTSEKKRGIPGPLMAAMAVAFAATEANDLLDALWAAYAKDKWTRTKRGWKKGLATPSPAEKARKLFWEGKIKETTVQDVLVQVIRNEIEDQLVGRTSAAASKLARRNGVQDILNHAKLHAPPPVRERLPGVTTIW